jgi:hypothetical protein
VLLAAQSTEQIELHRRIDGAGIASGADFFARGKIATFGAGQEERNCSAY